MPPKKKKAEPIKEEHADFSDIVSEPSVPDILVSTDDSPHDSPDDSTVPRCSIVTEEFVAPDADRSGEVKPPVFVLTEQQEEAKERILQWAQGPDQVFRLSGTAGTGKTSLVKYLIKEFSSKFIATQASSFTAKACTVLRSKGVPACTLHSLMYTPHKKANGKIEWIKKSTLAPDLVIVDEASMVSHELYDDLLSFGVKLLFIGDHAQLEPVGDNPNLMRDADYVLTEVHRQAKESHILRLATEVREGRTDIPLGEWGVDGNRLRVLRSMYGLNLNEFDIILCAKNLTRHSLNAKRRLQLGFSGEPQAGESVVCLKNDRETSVYNGLTTKILSVDTATKFSGVDALPVDLEDDLGDRYYSIPMRLDTFGRDNKKVYSDKTRAIPFDFSYVLTIHKSQGSQFSKVLFLDEELYNTDRQRIRYTAITRAEQELTVVLM